jgi:nucleoid-associated protein YgaU
MPVRFLSLVALHLALRLMAPAWSVVDWADPVLWVASAGTDEAAAALVRLLGLLATGSQALAIALAAAADHLGQVRILANRLLIPTLRRAAPLVLVAGTAIPAAAADHRLPILPPLPIVEAPAPPGVVVEPGDNMWRIAARHTDGPTAPYWVDLVDLNRSRFRDVDLIHPGDTVLLPPFRPAS